MISWHYVQFSYGVDARLKEYATYRRAADSEDNANFKSSSRRAMSSFQTRFAFR